jgi:PTS system nitrogen regulatory IIA component
MQLTVQDVAEIFGVPERTVYRWVHEQDLPAREVNGKHLFDRTELLEWASVRKMTFSPALLRERSGISTGTALSLATALDAGGVHALDPSPTLAAVFRQVAERVPGLQDSQRTLLDQLLTDREAAGSTAVGDGIAIPHPRFPMVLSIDHPIVSVCYLGRPIDFRARDGNPIDTLFILIAPTIRSHLAMLSQIAFALRDPGLIEAIRRRAAAEDLIRLIRRLDAASGPNPAPAKGMS